MLKQSTKLVKKRNADSTSEYSFHQNENISSELDDLHKTKTKTKKKRFGTSSEYAWCFLKSRNPIRRRLIQLIRWRYVLPFSSSIFYFYPGPTLTTLQLLVWAKCQNTSSRAVIFVIQVLLFIK